MNPSLKKSSNGTGFTWDLEKTDTSSGYDDKARPLERIMPDIVTRSRRVFWLLFFDNTPCTAFRLGRLCTKPFRAEQLCLGGRNKENPSQELFLAILYIYFFFFTFLDHSESNIRLQQKVFAEKAISSSKLPIRPNGHDKLNIYPE